MLRRLASLVASTAVALTALAAAAPAAHASTEESRFVTLTNAARANAGLHGYSVATDLVSIARRHSQEMAAKHTIYHNPNLANEVTNWYAVGENVGMGGTADSIHQAFMNSPAHKANILDHDYTQVGIGTARDSSGVLYVTEVFRKPEHVTTTTTAPKTTTTTTRTRSTTPTTTTHTATFRPVSTAVAPKATTPKAVSPRVALDRRLAAARKIAAANNGAGALGRAVAYLNVMSSLA